MVRVTLFCFLLSLCLCDRGLHAQSGADRPIQLTTAGGSSQLSYREIWQQMHRLPPIPTTAGAARSRAVPDATPGSNPNFAGFYAAQTLPGIAPVGGPLAAFPQTANPARIAFLTADFNNDGHPDLVTVDRNGGVAVSLNDGSGHLGTPVMTAPTLASLNALSVVATDLNGDGFPDLVVLTQDSQIVVLTNQRNGAFTQTAILVLPNAPSGQQAFHGSFSVAFTAGMTGNSKAADVIAEYIIAPPPPLLNTVNTTPTTMYRVTFLNDGAGGFSNAAQKLVSTTVPASYTLLPGRLILADVNHDGKPDLVTGIGSSPTYMASYKVDVAMGNGDGTFAALAANTVATVPGDKSPAKESPSLLLTSLTRNAGALDLLIAIDNDVYYAAADGDGTYKTPVLTLQRGTFQSENIASIQVEDFDGDSLPDLFVSGAGELTSYPGNGDGTFGKAVSSVVTNTSDASYPGVALADFDSDGKLDFVASSYQSQDVAFGKGLGSGKFVATPFLYTPALPPDSFAASAAFDANGDGKTDLVGENLDDGTLITALTGVGGTFTYKVALPASTTTYTVPQSVYGDFNGDGKPDLVVSLTTVGTPNVYGAGVALSNGDGTFQTPVPIQLPVPFAHAIQYNAVGDVNGDGKLDLVSTYDGDSLGSSTQGTPGGYLVALGNGDGTFHEATFVPFGTTPRYALLERFHGNSAPLDLVIADVNFPQVSNQQVSLLTGTGDGTFGSPTVLASGYYFFGLLAADFNKDGNPDLIISAPLSFNNYPSPGGFLAYTGHGDGTFSPAIVMAANGFPGTAIAADVNGDGNLDIVFSSVPLYVTGLPLSVSGLSVLPGNGDSTFGEVRGYPMKETTTLLAGNFLGDNTQSVISNAAESAFFMNQGGTLVTLTSTPSTLSAQVAPTLSGRPTPTGTATFLDGTTVLGTSALANGAANVDLSQLTVGTHTIAFQYSGDANFQPNTASSTITVTTVPTPDFSISSNPASLNVARGQTVKAQLTITANAGLSGSVTFACSGLPVESACSFAPATLTASPGKASSTTLTISTTAPSSAMRELAGVTKARAMTALAFLLIVPLCNGRRRQWLRLSLLIGVVALSTASILGCGGSGSSSKGSADTGSPAGSYTVTVTATSGSGGATITHTLPLTVVIQ